MPILNKTRKKKQTKGSGSREEIEVPQEPQPDEAHGEEVDDEGGAAETAQAPPTRGRGRGRGRGAVRNSSAVMQKDKPRRASPTILSEVIKEDILDWIQENECLYNKGEYFTCLFHNQLFFHVIRFKICQ